MGNHPIESLMTTAMENIKEMVDVNTIVGDAVQSPDGTVIIPVSRVSFGFASGGGEYVASISSAGENEEEDEGPSKKDRKMPFAGGSGAGVSISPVAFMVVGQNQIRLLPVTLNNTPVDKLLELMPEMVQKINQILQRKLDGRKEINVCDPPRAGVKEETVKKVTREESGQ